MLRKRLKNEEEGAGELDEGESSKKKSSKTDKSLVCGALVIIVIDRIAGEIIRLVL